MNDKQKARMRRAIARLEKAVKGEYLSRSTGEEMDEAKLELRNARMSVMATAKWLMDETEIGTRKHCESLVEAKPRWRD